MDLYAMDQEMLTMDRTGEGFQLLPGGDYETRTFINTKKPAVEEPILAEDDIDRENYTGNTDKTSLRYDSGGNEVNTCKSNTGIVIPRQDDELIGHSSTVGSKKKVSNIISIEERNQPSGDAWLPTFMLLPGDYSDCSKSRGICSDANVNTTASSILVGKRKQLDEDDYNTTSDDDSVTSTERIPDFERIPENWEISFDDDIPSSMSKYDNSKIYSDPYIAHAGYNESDTLRDDGISEGASIPYEILEDSRRSDEDNALQKGETISTGLSTDLDLFNEVNCKQYDKDEAITTELNIDICLSSGISGDDFKESGEVGALQRDDAVKLNRDAELPSEDDCDRSGKDEAAAKELNRDSDLSRKILGDDFKESGEVDALQSDDAMTAELNRNADLLSAYISGYFYKDDDAFKRDEAISKDGLKDTDLPNEVFEVFLRNPYEGNALKSNEPKSTDLNSDAHILSEDILESKEDIPASQPLLYNYIGLDPHAETKTPVEHCKQLDQGNHKTEDNSDLSTQILSKNSDESIENPIHVCDISTSNELKQLPAATTFKDFDVKIKNNDKNEPLTDGSKCVFCKNAMGGRKTSAVSSMIDKFNTLLPSAVPPTEKDKFKPKSIKFATSKDVNGCTEVLKQETACQNLVSNDKAVNNRNNNCENLKGGHESSPREAIAIADSRTNVISDSDTQEHRDTSISEVEKHDVNCDTEGKFGDSSAIETNNKSQELDITSERDLDQAGKIVMAEVGFQENCHHQSRSELVEQSWETNVIESPSESNSIRLGSTFGSLDADDEFSSPDDCKSTTPTSPKSECEYGNLYQNGVICVHKNETLLKVNKVEMGEVLDDLPAKNEIQNKRYEEHTNDHKDVSMIPHNTSVDPKILVANLVISLPVDSQELNDSEVLNQESSQYVFQEAINETVKEVPNEPLDIQDPVNQESSQYVSQKAIDETVNEVPNEPLDMQDPVNKESSQYVSQKDIDETVKEVPNEPLDMEDPVNQESSQYVSQKAIDETVKEVPNEPLDMEDPVNQESSQYVSQKAIDETVKEVSKDSLDMQDPVNQESLQYVSQKAIDETVKEVPNEPLDMEDPVNQESSQYVSQKAIDETVKEVPKEPLDIQDPVNQESSPYVSQEAIDETVKKVPKEPLDMQDPVNQESSQYVSQKAIDKTVNEVPKEPLDMEDPVNQESSQYVSQKAIDETVKEVPNEPLDMEDPVNQESSQYVSQKAIDETVKEVLNEPLDMEDPELIYLDAESGELNEQSVSSWDHVVSSLNSSAYQSSSEMQECIQLYANPDMRSGESSIYDDVASGSNLEFSSVVNNSEAPELKYVSSYQSDSGSCSNFFSDEGDFKQSDNQDGYLSALDLTEDLNGRSASGCCEPCELGSETYVSKEQGNDCHVEISVNEEQEEHQKDKNGSLFQIVKQMIFPPEEEKKSESPIEKTDILCETMDHMDTMTIGLTGEAESKHFNSDSKCDECIIRQEDREQEEGVSQVQTSLTSAREEAISEECNSVIYYEDIVETTTKKETPTNEGSDNFTKESDCMTHDAGEIDGVNLRDQAGEMDNIQDISSKGDHPHVESALTEKVDNHAIEDERSSIRDKVESQALSATFDNDNSCSEELMDMPVDISNNDSTLQDLPHETAEVKETKSEASSDDEEDAETKDACCKEYQVVLKRMKKLKKAMEMLTEQVSREKTYLQEETEKYMNRPRCKLTLFEHKLMEVQRENWLESQRAKISREEYLRRLQEADQMCVDEIQHMDAAEEKLRHLARITDVWTQTQVVLPYYDLPSLDLAEPVEEVTPMKVDELETQVVDLIGPSDVYMTSWLLNEAKKVKANYPVVGDKTSHIQNLNDLSVDQMLLPPHLLEKLEEMRDLVKANSYPDCSQNANGNCDPHKLQIKECKSGDALLTHQTNLTDAKRSAK